MLIKEKIGNLHLFTINNRTIDYVVLEWYETNKRILHKKTIGGTEVAMKFLSEKQSLTDGDVVYEDDVSIIAISVKECEAIIVQPKTMFEMASLCYEIGNKHIPLFYQNEEILVAFEAPLFKLLLATGYTVTQAKKKLLHPIKTTVSPHGHQGGNSLFSKIMNLTNPAE